MKNQRDGKATERPGSDWERGARDEGSSVPSVIDPEEEATTEFEIDGRTGVKRGPRLREGAAADEP